MDPDAAQQAAQQRSYLDFNQLTDQELQFRRQFKQEDIFEWLSGSPIHPPDYNVYIRICSSINHEPQFQRKID